MAETKKTIKKATERDFTVLVKPLITEKGTLVASHGKIAFQVATSATKEEIKNAVESIYGAEVVSVNTLNQSGKRRVFRGVRGKKADFKKAYVTLKEGSNIDITENVK
ncbi:MAG: 50S ribosomal protein L23 [Alphaproteobacteria bacterium]|jgi:large subunit ribosomal protein L23|nr:50S ribosomal protein L23 [Alphaproteobacteria bacterium]